MEKGGPYDPTPAKHLLELKMQKIGLTRMTDDPSFEADEYYHQKIDDLDEDIKKIEGTLSEEERNDVEYDFVHKKIDHFAKYFKKFPDWYKPKMG